MRIRFRDLAEESRRKLDKLGIWTWFELWCNEHVDYTEDIESRTVIGLISHILKAFDEPRYVGWVKHMLKFTVPSDDGTPYLLVVPGDAEKVHEAGSKNLVLSSQMLWSDPAETCLWCMPTKYIQSVISSACTTEWDSAGSEQIRFGSTSLFASMASLGQPAESLYYRDEDFQAQCAAEGSCAELCLLSHLHLRAARRQRQEGEGSRQR